MAITFSLFNYYIKDGRVQPVESDNGDRSHRLIIIDVARGNAFSFNLILTT